MAEGAGKGENPESRKELQVLIDQINSEPHYRVIPKDEYEMLVKNSHMSTKPPITSTPRAPFAHLENIMQSFYSDYQREDTNSKFL
uniref:Uncharacterized protein n=1 Tax=Magallana gigas TaxID=29159 RepID=A0A8W8MB71_MAGGI